MESGREGCREVALIRLGLAKVLLDDRPEQREQALEHLDLAIGKFQAMKMQPSLERARSRARDSQGVV